MVQFEFRLGSLAGGLLVVALGKKGGKARAKNLTPQERSEGARKAVLVRWGKVKAKMG